VNGREQPPVELTPTGMAERRAKLTGNDRWESPQKTGWDSDTDVAAKRKVVDYMNGDISRTELMDHLEKSGLPYGKIASFTQRIGEDGPSIGEIDAMMARREKASATGGNAIAEAAHEAATSPKNDLPAPTDAQKEAGNYAKGHVSFNGLNISIENPAGTKRSPEWPALKNHYGYFKGSVGADKDHVDVFLTDRADDTSLPVFVVDQVNADGSFDEHKVVLGVATEAEARQTYLQNYEEGWSGLGAITQMSLDDFKAWLADPAKTKKPAAQQDANDFIEAPGGGIDYGEITPEMSKAMRRQAGKIRLQRGDESFGLQHIEQRHGKEIREAGFASVEEFVSGAVSDIEAIWKPAATSQLVVIQSTERGKVVFIQLQAGRDEAGDFYTVKTAFPSSRSYAEKRKGWKELWSRVPVPAADAGTSASSAEPGNEAGSKSAMESSQSLEASVPPEATEAQPTPQPTKAEDGGGKIEDFGEKLPPARRAMAAKLSETLTDEDIAGQPLSKIWPLEENEAIEDTFAAAVAHVMREAIPAKPRTSYKVRSWVSKVKVLRDFAAKILRGTVSKETFLAEMDKLSSLRDMRSKINLLEQIDREQWKRIGDVSEAPGAIRYEDGKAIPSPSATVTIDGKSHWFKGSGNLADHMDAIKAMLTGDAPESKLKFEVFRATTGDRKIFISKKGDKEYRRLMEFDSVEAARKAIKDQYADLVAAWEGVKDRDNISEKDLRTAENRPRTGKDWRKGRDVSAEEFQEQFGFRGGEFGKWVSQGKGAQERQFMLNSAYDALMDLSEILGVPPKAISLEGSLGIAFGSRGGGWASAHFEPSNLVINLTKPRGAGALAHEWFHALDNYFARKRNGGEVPITRGLDAQNEYRRNNYITHKTRPMMVRKDGRGSPVTRERLAEWRKSSPGSAYLAEDQWIEDPNHKQGVRAEVEERFDELVKALDASPMLKRARTLDGVKLGDGYWSRTLERAARSFENYVQTRMMEQGYHNDFLANVKDASNVGKNQDRYPYLLPSEVAPIADAFGNLFQTIQTRETDSGNVEMFSIAEATASNYNDRIDALFSGQPAERAGVKVLDSSDVMAMLGYADKPVVLAESKVIQGMANHPEMTADIWKKIPNWLENPAAVFDSETDGGLVVIAPELVGGKAVSVIVRPDADGRGALNVHLLLNAYTRSASTPYQRWISQGLLKYADQKKFPALYETVAGRQLPSTAIQNKPGMQRILTEKNLAGYRKSIGADGRAQLSIAEQQNRAEQHKPASEVHRKAVEGFAARLNQQRSRPVVMEAVTPGTGEQGKKARSVAAISRKLFGREVVFVRFPNGDPVFNGAVSRANPGKIFLNIDSERPLMAVLGHELLHELRKSDPKAYDELDNRLTKLTRNYDIYSTRVERKYREAGMKSLPADIVEELHADMVGDHFTEPEFWQALTMTSQEKPLLWRRVIDVVQRWLKGIFNKLGRMKETNDGDLMLTVAQQSDGKRPFGTNLFLSDIDASRNAVLEAFKTFDRGNQRGRGDRLSVARGTTTSMPENKAPGPQGDAQQGASTGNAVTEQQEKDSQPADGFTRLYHSGSDPVRGGYFQSVPSGGVFDGMFALRGRWGNYGTGAKYFADIADDKILSQRELDYDIDYEKSSQALRDVMPWLEDGDFDTAWQAVAEDQSDRVDDAELMRIMREDDVGAASWEAQRLRGRLAKALGYQAVEMKDENGTSFLIVDGTPLTRVIPNDQSAPDTGGAMSAADTDQTKTEAFKRWFGDSKVVDANGDPLVVYHGTKADFSAFSLEKFGQTDGGWAGEGFYFAPNPAEASVYATSMAAPYGSSTGANVMPVFLSAKNPLEWRLGSDKDQRIQKKRNELGAKEFAEWVQSQGYDAIHITSPDIGKVKGEDQWVVFRPTQVKSATGNNGNFDPEDADIRFSIADAAVERIKQFDVKEAPRNTWGHYRGMLMQTLGRRQIVDLFQQELPQLVEYDRLVQNMDAEKNDSGAEADRLAGEWGKLDRVTGKEGEERRLAELMHDATLAQIDPEKEFVKGDNRIKYGELKNRFDKLTPEAQAIYRQTRDMYADHYNKVREAIKDRIERSELSASRKKEMMAKMDDDFFKKVKGVYFPLARFGSYVMVTKDASGEVVNVTRAETLNEAQQARRQIMAAFPKEQGYTTTKVMKDAEFNPGRDAVGKGFMADLFETLDQKGVDDALRDAVSQLYLSSLPDLSWAKHGIHRKGTPGFSQDARRAFAQNMFHGARYLAKLRYADQMQTQLEQMQEHIKAYQGVDEYDGVLAQQVVDEMVKRHENLMNPKVNPVSTALTSIGFVFHLGLSPASAMVNLTQTALVAYPIMGAKWGYNRASAALLKASQEVVRAKNDLSKFLTGDELDAFNKAVKDGTIDVTMAHDLAGISQGEDQKVVWAMRPVMRAASFMFHHAEKFNRQATFMAAYRLSKATGKDSATAYEEAKKATYDGHHDYAASNRPRIMQGNWQKVIFLFKQYAQNMIYSLSRNAYLSVKALDPAERTQARKTLAGILAMHASAAGILGLPLVGPLLAAASFMGGDDDEPWDAEVAMQNMLADTFGPKAAEVMARGFSRLTPFDLSGRVALNKLILPDVYEGLEGQQWAESFLTSAAGPVAGIFTGFVKGLQKIMDGDYQRGLEDMMPAALRGPLKAIRYGSEGAVDKSGVVILDDVGPAGVVGQALGLSPSEVRRATERKGAIMDYDRALADRRSTLMRQWSEARMASDSEGMVEAMEEIQAFNQKNPTRRITVPNLLQSFKARQKRINEAEDGVYLPRNRRDANDAVTF